MTAFDHVLPRFLREEVAQGGDKARGPLEELRLREGFPLRAGSGGEARTCPAWQGRTLTQEDLPRVFERGFTGYNGRREQRSSGIGLYLCRRILDRLGHTITIASVPGEGTTVRIGLDSRKMRVE